MLVKVYRESFKLYAVQGLLFNHESERRGEEFVTRKITIGIGKILEALNSKKSFEPLKLGNLDSKRDWSHSKDFVDGVWRMLNQEKFNSELLDKLSGYPYYITKEDRKGLERHLQIQEDIKVLSKYVKEYILSSNETHTVREFVELALKEANIIGNWKGEGLNERFISNGQIIVEINPKFFRPAEVDILLGDSSLARKELGWKPNISFTELVKRMCNEDFPKTENR